MDELLALNTAKSVQMAMIQSERLVLFVQFFPKWLAIYYPV